MWRRPWRRSGTSRSRSEATEPEARPESLERETGLEPATFSLEG